MYPCLSVKEYIQQEYKHCSAETWPLGMILPLHAREGLPILQRFIFPLLEMNTDTGRQRKASEQYRAIQNPPPQGFSTLRNLERPLTNAFKSCIFPAEWFCQCTSILSQTYAIAVSPWRLNLQKILKQCWWNKGFPCLWCKIKKKKKKKSFLQINVLTKKL